MIMNHIKLSAIRGLREFRQGEPAYDVRKIGTPVSNESLNLKTQFLAIAPWAAATALNSGPYFELQGFDDSGVDYFDSLARNGQGAGVWSIGQHNKTGRIIAS